MSKKQDGLEKLENNLEHLPHAFESCDKVVRTEYMRAGNLPVYVGTRVIDGEKEVLFSMGGNAPYRMGSEELMYLRKSLEMISDDLPTIDNTIVIDESKIIKQDGFKAPDFKPDHALEALKKLITGAAENVIEGSQSPQEAAKGVTNKLKELLAGGEEIKTNITEEELREMLKQSSEESEISEQEEAIDAQLEALGINAQSAAKDVKKQIEEQKVDIDKALENLTPEERDELNKKNAKERQEALFAKAKELEKELLGTIKTEEDIVYNLAHFRKVFKEGKLPALREELAKIPKSMRQDIIDQLVKTETEQS